VTAGTNQLQFVTLDAVNQKPVGLNVALPEAFPVPDQRVISIPFVERLTSGQRNDNGLQFRQTSALPLKSLDVAPKLR
jgi:hypothetical protein